VIVVSDTSPIRALAHLGHLGLLQSLFDEVLVPPTVADELKVPRRLLPALDIASVPAARVQSPVDRARVAMLSHDLDPGESEAIALALEVRADHLLIDEWAGRQAAITLGLRPLGVLGLLVKAKQAGLIQEVKPLIARLEAEINFFVGEVVRAEILRDAGE
jgi:predicted nucleic acid-binding protein